MGPWIYVVFSHGIDQADEPWIPVGLLPAAYASMMIVHVIVTSTVVLVSYGRQSDGDEQ